MRQPDGMIDRMTRFGPLHSVPPALIVGDPTRRHLVLDREGVRYVSDGKTLDTYPWRQVEKIETDLPETWFRYPGALAGLTMSLIAIVTHDTPDFRAKPGAVKMTREGMETSVHIDTHHLVGYWRGAAAATQRLLDRLVSDVPSRALLSNPDTLVRTVAASTRWFR